MTSLLTDETLSWVGRTLQTRTHAVSRADIAKFALAIGAREPLYFDAEAARARGFADCVAPLGYHVAIRMSGPNLIPLHELGGDGVSTEGIPPSRASRVMAGTTTARFHRRITAADLITVRTKISDIVEKQGKTRPLILVTYALDYSDQHGSPVVAERYSRVLQ
ncbi:MaoC family dehydratase N-terminal domain-containing protein [Nocardia salmonicida]|uniref:FAS1-like dehydratase domain-containing protein n=1 Tax=Nocardia salmonicida TaxID=53431 RepID=UPI00366F6C1B